MHVIPRGSKVPKMRFVFLFYVLFFSFCKITNNWERRMDERTDGPMGRACYREASIYRVRIQKRWKKLRFVISFPRRKKTDLLSRLSQFLPNFHIQIKVKLICWQLTDEERCPDEPEERGTVGRTRGAGVVSFCTTSVQRREREVKRKRHLNLLQKIIGVWSTGLSVCMSVMRERVSERENVIC